MSLRHSIVLMLVNVVLVIIIIMLICFFDISSSVTEFPINTYYVTCSMCCPANVIFTFGEFCFMLITISIVFFILIFIPNCLPTSFILLLNSESCFSLPANIAVSSAYI